MEKNLVGGLIKQLCNMSENMKIKLMIVNGSNERCGVYDFGFRVNHILSKSNLLDISYCVIHNLDEYEYCFHNNLPDVVLYNYHCNTLPYINDLCLQNKKRAKHVVIYHEDHINFSPDAVIGDSSIQEDVDNWVFRSLCPIYEDIPIKFIDNKIPIIGSCGFATHGKNFPRIADLVCEQFEKAIIRISMGFNYYMDKDGKRAKEEVRKMEQIIAKKNNNIILEVYHDHLEPIQLVEFLMQSDLNLFLYNQTLKPSATSSGSIDCALSARRPIGISNCNRFKHINSVNPSILVDKVPLKEIIKNGIKPLIPIYDEHSNAEFIKKYEYIISKVINKS
jgi:hypothetical protein